ncbi:MAG: DUF481 domain-containing protein [Proteobacteria bacterium]|nr:DUF481 domain-containing protein [Pseudomonadota bacterium]
MRATSSHAMLGLVLWLAVSSAGAAPKTDIITLRNGDRLTAELKSLDRGKLVISTDAGGTIELDWDMVAAVVTNQRLQLETYDGKVLLGSLVPDTSETIGKLVIQDGEQSTRVPILDVVRIAPLEDQLLKRFKGEVSAGYSLYRANQQEQFNFDLKMEYRTPQFLGKFGSELTSNSSTAEETSRRDSASLELYHLFNDRWFAGAVTKADRNDELGIKNRLSVGAAGGRFMVQSNSKLWTLVGGVLDTRENDYDNPEGPYHTVEGLFGTQFDWFRYHKPEFDLSTSLLVLPNFTESGRWRATYSVGFKWQIYKDFFWRIKFDGDYDSRPRAAGASKDDYALITSLGSTF